MYPRLDKNLMYPRLDKNHMYPRLDKKHMYPRLVLPMELHLQLFARLPFPAARESYS